MITSTCASFDADDCWASAVAGGASLMLFWRRVVGILLEQMQQIRCARLNELLYLYVKARTVFVKRKEAFERITEGLDR